MVANGGVQPAKRGIIVGDQALAIRRDDMNVTPAFDANGLVANWEAYEGLLAHAYSTGVQAASEDFAVMYAEPTHACIRQRERIGELLFETHGAPALAVSPAVVLAAYANGRHTGVVLDVGDATTTAAPVLDGTVARSLVLRTRVAGRSLSEAVAGQTRDAKIPIRPLWSYRRLMGEAAAAARDQQRAIAEADAAVEATALADAAEAAAATAASTATAAAAAEQAAEAGDEITPVSGGANGGALGGAAGVAAATAATAAAASAVATAAAARRPSASSAALARRLARLPPPVQELSFPGTTPSYDAFARLRLVESIKEALCRVEEPLSAAAAATAKAAAAAGGPGAVGADGDDSDGESDVRFTLPDGNVVDLGGPRQFAAAAALFGRLPHIPPPRAALAAAAGISFAAPAASAAHTAAYGSAATGSSAGLSGLVLDALRSADQSTHKDLWAGICLTGGTSNLGGLFERLSGELMGHHFRARVLAASGVPERRFCTWTGGSILATFTDFQRMWVSKADYEEVCWRLCSWWNGVGALLWAGGGRMGGLPRPLRDCSTPLRWAVQTMETAFGRRRTRDAAAA